MSSSDWDPKEIASEVTGIAEGTVKERLGDMVKDGEDPKWATWPL